MDDSIRTPISLRVTLLAQYRQLSPKKRTAIDQKLLQQILQYFLQIMVQMQEEGIKLLEHIRSNRRAASISSSNIYLYYAEGDGQQSTNKWNGVFSVSSYTEYFNVDTNLVLNRLMSSLNPTTGDFFSKIDANPDLYGLVWISTTLVFVLSSIGNCATYLMHKRSDSNSSWNFDVNYVNVAACSVYGYALLVPLGFYSCFDIWV